VEICRSVPAPSLPRGGDDRTPLRSAAFSVVDLETTGLSPAKATIIEIGAVRIEGLRVTTRFESLVDPRRPLSPKISRLTGITDAMLAGAPSGGEALRRFRQWMGDGPGGAFVAHHARFDEGFVRRGLARSGLRPLIGPVLCTRLLARRLAPELRRFGLDHLAEGFGIRFSARHRALGDAEATAAALLHLVGRAQRDHAVETLGDLVRLQAAPPPKRPRSPSDQKLG
jgi:DNA polymerase III epsilon subunit family exonuclease